MSDSNVIHKNNVNNHDFIKKGNPTRHFKKMRTQQFDKIGENNISQSLDFKEWYLEQFDQKIDDFHIENLANSNDWKIENSLGFCDWQTFLST